MAKRVYFQAKIDENRGDSSKIWRQLKTLGYDSQPSRSCIVLEHQDMKVHDSFMVSNIFNRFYTSVASQLVAKLPSPSGVYATTSRVFRQFYGRFSGMRHSFTLSPVSRVFVLKQLRSLDPKKAVGLDNVSPRFLKDAADAIVEPVTHLINLSIITETVPHGFKQAKVTPLFKKGSRLDPGNYRPVSVLNVLSKILERTVHCPFQFRSRENCQA